MTLSFSVHNFDTVCVVFGVCFVLQFYYIKQAFIFLDKMCPFEISSFVSSGCTLLGDGSDRCLACLCDLSIKGSPRGVIPIRVEELAN